MPPPKASFRPPKLDAKTLKLRWPPRNHTQANPKVLRAQRGGLGGGLVLKPWLSCINLDGFVRSFSIEKIPFGTTMESLYDLIWYFWFSFFWTSSHAVKHLKIKGWYGHCGHSTYSLASAIIALDLQAYVSFKNDRICSMNMFFCLVCKQYFAPKTYQSPLETECQDQQQASQQCNATASRHGFWKLAPGGLYRAFFGEGINWAKVCSNSLGVFSGKICVTFWTLLGHVQSQDRWSA